jgi:hypothetical protein
MFAKALVASDILEARTTALVVHFDAMAFEHFLITTELATFKAQLENQTSAAAREFSCSADILNNRQQQWIARASGRTTLQGARLERTPKSFWRELSAEFRKLDGMGLWAHLPDTGWWLIGGGPTDPAAKDNLRVDLALLCRRAVAALGFDERSVAESVWLDALYKENPHSFANRIDHLCRACADYCFELETRSIREALKSRSAKRRAMVNSTSAAQSERLSGGQGPAVVSDAQSPPAGDPAPALTGSDREPLIDGKEHVMVRIAARYLERTEDHVRRLVRMRRLVRIGKLRPIRVSTRSLREYKRS